MDSLFWSMEKFSLWIKRIWCIWSTKISLLKWAIVIEFYQLMKCFIMSLLLFLLSIYGQFCPLIPVKVQFVVVQGVYAKSLHFLNIVFSDFLLNKILIYMTLFLQNFVSFQNMPIFWSSDDHRMRQGCLIKI